jgi:hypothetical protein
MRIQLTGNAKQMRRSMNEFTAKAFRPSLGPEQLKKLKELRNSGQLSKEQQAQIDAILNQ